MEFQNSSQAKFWLFDEQSLALCQEQAVRTGCERVGKFASGFHWRSRDSDAEVTLSDFNGTCSDVSNQKIIVQLHANEIRTLIGPTAILEQLKTSLKTLWTAVSFFRRFYLSNSIIEIDPRTIAVACCFLAAKVEEEKIQVRLSFHPIVLVKDESSEAAGPFFVPDSGVNT